MQVTSQDYWDAEFNQTRDSNTNPVTNETQPLDSFEQADPLNDSLFTSH